MQKAVALSPRNEKYQFNLAQIYMNNRQPDAAIAILQVLVRNGSAEVAERAGKALEEALQFRDGDRGAAGRRQRKRNRERWGSTCLLLYRNRYRCKLHRRRTRSRNSKSDPAQLS